MLNKQYTKACKAQLVCGMERNAFIAIVEVMSRPVVSQMEGLPCRQRCPLLPKYRDQPVFTSSVSHKALTYTGGAGSVTTRWSERFKHPHVSKIKIEDYPEDARLQSQLHHTRVKQIKQLWDQICVRCKCFISLPSSAPDQLYVKPVTDSMQYGWRVSQTIEPWMQIKRFPKRNSEMTEWVTNLCVAIVLHEVNYVSV